LAETLKPDLALMDIMLKGTMTGIEAAEEIKKRVDIPIIFLTAYADESTLSRAKVTEPHGYILKPFKEIDIHTSIEMAIHKHSKEKDLKIETELLRALAAPKMDAAYIFVKHKGQLLRVHSKHILYVEALKDYVTIVTKDDKYTIHSTMKDIEQKLFAPNFLRAHRSFIVNMDHVASIQNNNLIMNEVKKEIPIGGSYKDAVASVINLL
jgi:DNA-binding LytR/AlgR family response regulator